MNPHCLYITQETTWSQLIYVVNVMPRRSVPLVLSVDHPVLLGAVTKSTLVSILRRFYAANDLENVEADLGLGRSMGNIDRRP